MIRNNVDAFTKYIRGYCDQKGQALITLLFFMIIAITVTSAAIVMILVNSLSGTRYQQGELAYHVAQSGADNAILRLLRNPNYTGENDIVIGGGSVDIQVTGSGPYTITSTGSYGTFTRTVETTVNYVNNLLTITSQREIY